MPQLVDPADTTYIPMPTPRTAAPAPPRPPQPERPRDPFRQALGPAVLILPHAAGPTRMEQLDAPPVRFVAAHAPAGGGVHRGRLYPGSQFLPSTPPTLPPPVVEEQPPPKPGSSLRTPDRRGISAFRDV